MAGLPIDVKDILDAFGDIDAARHKPVTVAVLLDETAPVDLLDLARSCFSSIEANARVAVSYYDSAHIRLPYGCDLAVFAAGLSEHTGAAAENVRRAGTPVLVITTLPKLVTEIAQASGHPLIAEDIIAPAIATDEAALPAESAHFQEPYPIDMAREIQMRLEAGEWIVNIFQEKKLAFALCFPFVRKPLALDAVKATCMQNAAVGAVFIIPGADMPVMTANQAKMILQIAAAYGQKMGAERAKELIGVVAGAFALRTAARQIVGRIPVLGWVVKGAIGYTGTLAMGHAAIAYFEATVGQGKPVQEALDAARAEAERVSSIASQESNPLSAAKAVAQRYARDASTKVREVTDRAIPAVQGAVPAVREAVSGIAEAAGSTPGEIGQKAVETVIEASGKTPPEPVKKILSAALAAKKRGN